MVSMLVSMSGGQAGVLVLSCGDGVVSGMTGSTRSGQSSQNTLCRVSLCLPRQAGDGPYVGHDADALAGETMEQRFVWRLLPGEVSDLSTLFTAWLPFSDFTTSKVKYVPGGAEYGWLHK